MTLSESSWALFSSGQAPSCLPQSCLLSATFSDKARRPRCFHKKGGAVETIAQATAGVCLIGTYAFCNVVIITDTFRLNSWNVEDFTLSGLLSYSIYIFYIRILHTYSIYILYLHILSTYSIYIFYLHIISTYFIISALSLQTLSER